MKPLQRIFCVLTAFLVPCLLFSADLSTQRKIHESPGFIFYAEDSRDYSELFDLLERKNADFRNLFGTSLSEKIKVYIFSTQLTFSRCVFNSEEPVMNVTGLADHVSLRFYITSFYDSCKPRERLLQTPVHELVHLYFPSQWVWIREGTACYLAEMLTPDSAEDLPSRISELHFYSRGEEENKRAYNYSGWIIKYIFEECLGGSMKRFRQFSRTPSDFSILGFDGEASFFEGWKSYMRTASKQ